MHRDSREEEGEPRVWPDFHKDDILSIDLHQPSRIVASSSYDGEIKIWSLETGHVSCVLNANHYAGSKHARPVIPLELKRRVSQNNAGSKENFLFANACNGNNVSQKICPQS